MLINVTGKVDPSHDDIVLATGLWDQTSKEFYDITLRSALDEILMGEDIEVAIYEVDLQKSIDDTKLTKFTAWTKTKVIFLMQGIGYTDSLLEYVPRNPQRLA